MRKASTAARNTTPITVPSATCMETSTRIIRETGMITTGGVATTVAGGTVGGGTMGGDTNPRVLTPPPSRRRARSRPGARRLSGKAASRGRASPQHEQAGLRVHLPALGRRHDGGDVISSQRQATGGLGL